MKKILLGLGAVVVTLVSASMFAAFEAHVVNVTATIENALRVPLTSIDFGTVFPQEQLDRTLDVHLSQSFIDEDRVDDIDYIIRQKPKCELVSLNSAALPQFGRVTEDGQGNFVCEDEDNYDIMPLLCPYLSKHEISDDGLVAQNDSAGISAFHGLPGTWNLATTVATQVRGHLAKLQQDFDDLWNIDLKVPCFAGNCAQDWADYVFGINPDVNADDYIQPKDNEHKLFGCDLWLEVGGISLPGIGCSEEADTMLVLDRSGSIDAGELTTLKNAANAFVTALSPSTAGVHMGQTSFAFTGSLDQILTDSAAAMNAAINALVTGGTTNLSEGISLATAELASGNDRNDATSPDFMVVITDGAPNQPGGSEPSGQAAAIASANAADAADIEIFVVGVGTTQATSDFLKDNIATDAAHYFDAADFGSLEDILEGIAQCNEG